MVVGFTTIYAIGVFTSQGSTEKRGVGLSDTQIDAKIDKRNQARNNKNFDLSDQIRDELLWRVQTKY
jgi:cysteinyl-tRNA synthetase